MNKFVKFACVMVLLVAAAAAYAVSTNDQVVGSTAVSAGLKTPVILKGYADFAETASGAADVYKVVAIPAGYIVQAVACKMVTIESATSATTFTVGDLDNATQYIAARLMTNLTTLSVSAIASNKLYSSDGYIVVVPSAAATAGKVEVQVSVIPFK